MFSLSSITGISLESAGLVALADLKTISRRTALTGTASPLDILALAPGIHTQQSADEQNGGELPICGAMTTGYVFRVENQAMVHYLQRVGKTGCLTGVTVGVKEDANLAADVFLRRNEIISTACYLAACSLTILVVVLLGIIRDWWAIGIIATLMVARLINVVIIRRRAQKGWKGAPEPGVKGDLLVLLSQDRWIRIRGLVDDIKAVTAGQWLRDMTPIEDSLSSFASLLVFIAAALAGNSSTIGSLLTGALLLISVGLLGLCNMTMSEFRMYNRYVYVSERPKKYGRRLEMVNELIEETDRHDWAVGMGLILAKSREEKQAAQAKSDMYIVGTILDRTE